MPCMQYTGLGHGAEGVAMRNEECKRTVRSQRCSDRCSGQMRVDLHVPWSEAAATLSKFTVNRCVHLTHEDWRQLSEVLQQITKLCASAKQTGKLVPAIHVLNLFTRLGEVTASLLSLNGDEPTFSVARVAQAIRTTTQVLETLESSDDGGCGSHELADAVAHQQCQQTHLLSAITWALRQEARALFFNPRPTALSLATALLDLVRVITHTWHDEMFSPLLPAAAHDPAAGRLADPAAQLAGALLRCAGRAMTEVGPAAGQQLMISGLKVGYDLMRQLNSLLFDLQLSGEQVHARQLMQSPSVLHLIITMLAVQTQRLVDQFGVKQQDTYSLQQSLLRLQQQQQQQQEVKEEEGEAASVGGRQHSGSSSSMRCRTLDELEDEDDHAGPGDLHQLWAQVLQMGKKTTAPTAAGDEQQQQQQQQTTTPLQQLWSALGLPAAMLPLAAAAAVEEEFTGGPRSDYITACRVTRFLLQGSSHLHPPKEPGVSRSPPVGLAAAGSGEIIRPMFPDHRIDHDHDLISSGSTISDQDLRGRAASPTAAAAALLVDSCRDYGLRGLEEMEVLQLQRLVPLVLLDTAATLCSSSSSNTHEHPILHLEQQHKQQQQKLHFAKPPTAAAPAAACLDLIQVSCCAAASSARCWPVLERVTDVQWTSWSGLDDNAPAGVFPRLTALYWQQYEPAAGGDVPVQELLQLVCGLIQHLLGQQQQQHEEEEVGLQPHCAAGEEAVGAAAGTTNAAAAAAAGDDDGDVVLQPGQNGHEAAVQLHAQAGAAAVPLISPCAREALVALIEVLTSVSKLDWEPTVRTSGSSNAQQQQQQQQQQHRHHILQAWQEMCLPVAAVVEHVLRRAGAAAVANAAAVAAAAAAARKQQQQQQGVQTDSVSSDHRGFTTVYPTVVALGSCLAVMLSPLGRPGPLLVAAASPLPAAAAAAAADSGCQDVQMQLFALLVSEIKVLHSETSVKRELLAMHALEQAPLYMLEKLQQLQHGDNAITAAVPWLLLLARLLVLRGQLLFDLLCSNTSAAAGAPLADERSQFSMLHNTFWHLQMAEASATMLETYLQQINVMQQPCTAAAQFHLDQHGKVQQQKWQAHARTAADREYDMRQQTAPAAAAAAAIDSSKWHQLVLDLRQAVLLCKAAMKLARHYDETGFASGFAAGFAAGYAAALTSGAASPAGAALAVAFSSPVGILHQQQIMKLPQQLRAFGALAAERLAVPGECRNPSCMNLSTASELLLMGAAAATASGSSTAGGLIAPAAGVDGSSSGRCYCSVDCMTLHTMA